MMPLSIRMDSDVNKLKTNNLNVVMFESNLLRQEKRNQLVDLIGSGVVPSKFIVNATYNKIFPVR